MSDKTHPWIYVIIPVAKTNYGSPRNDLALFSAFCKDCRQYFTESIPWSSDGVAMVTPSALPRTGCRVGEVDEGFSTLPGIDRDPRSN